MELPELPRRLLVLGGGYIGCEFGQMFRRLGAEVAVFDRNTHLLSREEPEVSTALEGVFRDEGIALHLGVAIDRVSGGGGGGEIAVGWQGGEVRGSHLLVALGRSPNTDDLGCDAAGITRDKRGYIVVDDRYATSAAGVYAVGDCTGGPQFTHTSWDDHRILFELLRGRTTRTRASRTIPSSVFTDPQVASIGLTERQARARGLAIEVATMPFGNVARAIETDETAGVMKILIDAADERILGVTVCGPDAGELIHVFVPLVEAKLDARAASSTRSSCIPPSPRACRLW